MGAAMLVEFVQLAEKREDSFAALCARFGISRKTGYKWLKRYRAQGTDGLKELSRRPKSSPRRTPDAIVNAVWALRHAHPAWSASRLRDELAAQGASPLPATSTIDLILRRSREIAPPLPRLTEPAPNYRWIFSFTGELSLADGTSAVGACARDEFTGFILGTTVLTTRREEALDTWTRELLQRHGVPERIQFPRDHELQDQPAARAHSPLTVWLLQLGIDVEFRFEQPDAATAARRLLAERLAKLPSFQTAPLARRLPAAAPLEQFSDAASRLTAAAARPFLEQARERHNYRGPEFAATSRNPVSLYRPSARPLYTAAPATTIAPESDVRLISEKGIFTFQRRLVHVGRAFARLMIEVRPLPQRDRYQVILAGHSLGTFNLSLAPIDATTSVQLSVG
jgi:hypothetical protein